MFGAGEEGDGAPQNRALGGDAEAIIWDEDVFVVRRAWVKGSERGIFVMVKKLEK